MAYHQTTVMGNIGKFKDLKTTKSGSSVLEFSVAVTEKYKDNETTTWYPVKCYKKLAENIERFFSVGDSIFLTGKMNFYNYEKEGRTIYGYEFIAFTFSFTGKNKGGNDKSQYNDKYANTPKDDDDIPF